MTYDTPAPPPRTEAPPPPQIDVDMRQRQGDLRQTGTQDLRQTGTQQQNQEGRIQQSGTVRQDVAGNVQQNVDGNTLRTGDVRSANTNQAGGASIDDHRTINRTDKSVSMGTQFLPECTVGLSIGVPGSGAFQIGVPSKECIRERGKATEALAGAQVGIAQAQADATIATARANALAAIRKADAAAAEAIAKTEADKEVALQQQGDSHVQAMTKMSCDFSIDRAGTARQSWQQFDSVSSKIGRHPTAKAGAQQLWGEAVTSSAQSMEAGAVCVESTRSQLGIKAQKFEVPKLEFETPKPPKPAKPPEKPPAKEEDCLDKDKKKN
ncbi:MAG: hypothetical protein IT342_07475 [Candidatus Melainabacteria bacterium]|nr:hypothetical protein [Candidatus Melainabacteria bacterium]